MIIFCSGLVEIRKLKQLFTRIMIIQKVYSKFQKTAAFLMRLYALPNDRIRKSENVQT